MEHTYLELKKRLIIFIEIFLTYHYKVFLFCDRSEELD